MQAIVRSEHQRLLAPDTTFPPGALTAGARGTILRSALTLFARHGFDGTSIRQIADAAGLGSASLYSHFASKEHLLAELARLGHEEHLRRIRAALLEAGSQSPAQLAALVRAHVLVHAEYPALATVVNHDLHALPDELAGPSLTLRTQAELLLVEVIERGVADGTFRLGRPTLAAAAIAGMGLRVAAWFGPHLGMTADEVADDYAMFALRLVGHDG